MNTAVLSENWVGQVVDRRFPLVELLGNVGGHKSFRTEIEGDAAQPALIKLIAASGGEAEEQLDVWACAARLSHPHLVKLFASGLCTLDGQRMLYVVSELPEENLAQILPQRALTPAETGEMLRPVVEALAYVHEKGMVYGAFAPLDVLVVHDRIKLAADTLHRPGVLKAVSGAKRTYEAPETLNGAALAASDVWSLGITLIETLTQRPPMHADPVIPSSLPQPFAEIARRCLKVDPAQRCTLEQIRQMLDPRDGVSNSPVRNGAAASGAVPAAAGAAMANGSEKPRLVAARPTAAAGEAVPAAAVAGVAAATAERPESLGRIGRGAWETESEERTPRWHVPVLIAAAVLLLIVIGSVMFRSHKGQPAAPAENAGQNAPQSASRSPAAPGLAGRPGAGGAQRGVVLHRVLPEVPGRADRTIRGKVDVKIRVNVDAQGAVSSAAILSRDHSRYFANLALEAARRWKFRPAQSSAGQPVASAWTIQFIFRKNHTDASPVQTAP